MDNKLETLMENVHGSMLSRDLSFGGKLSFHASEEYRLDNSVAYSLQTRDFLLLSYEEERWHISDDPFFMLVEVGESGFKTSIQVAFCEVFGEVICYSPASPEDAERVTETYLNSGYSLSDTLSTATYLSKSKESLVKQVSETEFIRLEKSGCVRYPVEHGGKFFIIPKNARVMSSTGKLFAREAQVGSLVLETGDLEEWFRITELTSIVHDYKGNLYAMAKVKYVYPRDVVVIKELFPNLVNAGLSSAEKKKAKVYENCDVIEGRGFGKLGDRRIFIKVVDTYNDFAIRRGPFEFAAIEGASFEHLSDVHVGDERLIRVLQDNKMRICAPIEVDGLYDIVVYKFVRFFMCKDELCAIFDFAYDVGGFSKTMLTKVGGKDNENVRGIFYSYLYSGRLEPLQMDMDECEKWRIWNDMYGFEWARNY